MKNERFAVVFGIGQRTHLSKTVKKHPSVRAVDIDRPYFVVEGVLWSNLEQNGLTVGTHGRSIPGSKRVRDAVRRSQVENEHFTVRGCDESSLGRHLGSKSQGYYQDQHRDGVSNTHFRHFSSSRTLVDTRRSLLLP